LVIELSITLLKLELNLLNISCL